MKVCFIDKTEFQYNYQDINKPFIRGAENILINLSLDSSLEVCMTRFADNFIDLRFSRNSLSSKALSLAMIVLNKLLDVIFILS